MAESTDGKFRMGAKNAGVLFIEVAGEVFLSAGAVLGGVLAVDLSKNGKGKSDCGREVELRYCV